MASKRVVRTTIRMAEDLRRQAQAAAAKGEVTFTRFVEDAVRVAVKTRPAGKIARPRKIRLPTFSSPLQPGVDLNRSADLLSRMDDDAAL